MVGERCMVTISNRVEFPILNYQIGNRVGLLQLRFTNYTSTNQPNNREVYRAGVSLNGSSLLIVARGYQPNDRLGTTPRHQPSNAVSLRWGHRWLSGLLLVT